MKILKVIHGYPMRYNAGSEVYSQTLCHGLATKHEVHVFTREEDSFKPDFALHQEQDADVPSITLHLVNNPRLKDRYRCEAIDDRFDAVVSQVNPDVVHIGHLNHLSTSLVKRAAARSIPIVYTLHDYWVMCPRGQFMQMFPEDPEDLWAACTGQEDSKCAERCYIRYYSGAPNEWQEDHMHWTTWVKRRMKHMREMVDLVDLFIAPAKYLQNRYIQDFGLDPRKVRYLDYGFDLSRFPARERVSSEPFTFGYIGTHIPAKGIHHLIEAFGNLKGSAKLRIWGRDRGQDSKSLRALAASLPNGKADAIEWMTEYKNQNIVRDVFNHVDAIVVPSVWVENSPLVIHEAQQARVPVVTANTGGMAEYVHHEVNGLIYTHRSPDDMSRQMQRMLDDPKWAQSLGERGYVYSESGDIPSAEGQVKDIETIYTELIARKKATAITPTKGPWRITFDTNPDTCNLHCVMCEQHAPGIEPTNPPRVMPYELIERVVREAVPNGLKEIIPSTMGEPLLYADFDKIIELCKETGIKLNLTTNGTWPIKKASEWARQILPVASDIKISWNGATPEVQESIMTGSSWAKRVEDLKAFLAVKEEMKTGATVTLQLTFMESNLDEIPELIKWAIELGIDRVKGHHVWVHTPEMENSSLMRTTDRRAAWNKTLETVYTIVKDNKLPSGKQLRLDNFTQVPLEQVPLAEHLGTCPFLGKEAWVDTTGRFSPCCAPDEQRSTLGDFGTLATSTLKEIWESDAYKLLISSYRTRPLCMSCRMRQPMEVSHDLA